MNLSGLLQLVEPSAAESGYRTYFLHFADERPSAMHSPDEFGAILFYILSDVIGPSEGVAAGIAFRAARSGDTAPFQELMQVLSREKLPADLCSTSLRTGTALWQQSRRWNWTAGIHEQFDPISTPWVHHAPAFGALVSETTANEIRAIATYLFRTAKLLLCAAPSEIKPDDSTAQHILSQCQESITVLAQRFSGGNASSIAAVPS